MTDNRLTGKIEDWQNDRLSKMTGSRLARWLQIEKVEDNMTTDWRGRLQQEMKRWQTGHEKMSDSWQDDRRWQDYRKQMTKWRGNDKWQYNRWQDHTADD